MSQFTQMCQLLFLAITLALLSGLISLLRQEPMEPKYSKQKILLG